MYKQFRKISLSCLVLSALLLTISYSQSIVGVSPDSEYQGEDDLQVYLYASGVDFTDSYYSNYGIPQSVSFSEGGISTSNLYVVNSSTVRFNIDISLYAIPTSRDVTLQTYSYNYGYNTLYGDGGEFTVIEHPLANAEITSIDPNEVQQDGQYQINIYASGVNFTDSYSDVYSPFNSLSFSGGGIDVSNTQVYSDWIQTTINVDRFAYTGMRTLSVYTDNLPIYLYNALEITPTDDPIEITSVSPTEGVQGTNNLTLTIDIENADFYDYYNSVYFSDSDLSVGNKWIVDSNTIAAYVDISHWTNPGFYDLTIGVVGANGGQTEYDTFSGFEVTQSDHELLSISPSSSYLNTGGLIITLLASGVDFSDSYANNNVSFSDSGINVNWTNAISSSELQAQIDISSWASYGFSDVTVTTDNKIMGLEDAFEVKQPDVTLEPDEGFPGDAFEVNLIAGGFSFDDSYVSFDDLYGNPTVYFNDSNLNVDNVSLTSDNTMTFYLSIGETELGMKDIYIDQYSWLPDYSFYNVFEVKSPFSKIYVEPQQVIMAEQNEIPIRLFANEIDHIESVIFAVEVSPTDDNPSILADLGLEISDPNVTAMISSGGDGIASVVISGFDPAISGQELVIGNLLVDIPLEGLNQGDIYHLSISSVSGSTPDYEGIIIDGIENVELTAITKAPEFEGLSDVYVVEGESESVSFTVVDLGATPLSLSYDAPHYVSCSLDYVSGETEHSGSCNINSYMGAESGMVSLTVTNSEGLPETGDGSFSININHYPVLNITETIYAPVNESTSIDIELSDSDGDDLTLTLLSSPQYTEFNFTSPSSGTLDISPVDGDSDGEITFHATDDGNPEISTDIILQIIVNHAPQFDGFPSVVHVVKNDVLNFNIHFSDQNEDPISYNVDQLPGYGTYSEIENGLEFTFSPSGSDNSSNFQITISDPQGMSTTQSTNINVYNTYLAGDVRPSGGENAGDFGDDMLIAPDVVNALRVATSSPDTDIPDNASSLYDAFDVSPIDIDVNQDGDFYDDLEHGGDGYIEAADVIVSLKRATMMPGYPNIRRADVNYPFSTPMDNGGRIANRDDATDVLLFGNIEGHPGQTVQVPVYLRRGESESNLNGLISGFSIIGSDEEVPGLESEITFNIEVECSSMDIPSGNEFLSLLMMDLDDLAPSTETLLGTLDFTIPFSADTEDIYYIYSQGASGSSSNYTPIIFSEETYGSVTVEEPLIMMNAGLMHSGANLKSFYVLPEDGSLANMFSPLEDQIAGVIGEGEAALYSESLGWIGSLTHIDAKSGYWLNILEETDFSFYGYVVDPGLEYSLHSGANLISFPSYGSVGIADGIPDDVEDQFTGIIAEGSASMNMGDIWVGSLTAFEGTKGYWVIAQSALAFSYDLTNLSEDNASRLSITAKPPAGYEYKQSTEQAFYFIEYIHNIEPGDYWILAYNGDEVIGAREWTGSIIDVPAMGSDGSDYTNDYMKVGSTPQFKLLSGSDLIDLTGEVPAWSQNQLFMVSSLRPLPQSFSLSAAYPNPFNPTTTLNFALPIEVQVFLSIYNLQGREVVSLISGNMEAGYHSVVWNADSYSSGVYFVKMIAGEYMATQKLMLVK